MKKWTHLLSTGLLSALFVLSFGFASQAAEISGTIKFQGTPPKLGKIDMAADTYCQGAHSKPMFSEALVLGSGQTMGNILVNVKSGYAKKKYPTPTAAVVLDQKGCRYLPHVVAVMVNQKLKILNSDKTLHNLNGQPKVNRVFNDAMPPTVKEKSYKFRKAEKPFKIKCDVHPWMSSYLAVMDHPYFDVTAKDGKYTLKNLPAGTYEIEVWHEKLGTQTAKVTVGDSDKKSQNFTFKK